jgi:hypothetical protein
MGSASPPCGSMYSGHAPRFAAPWREMTVGQANHEGLGSGGTVCGDHA